MFLVLLIKRFVRRFHGAIECLILFFFTPLTILGITWNSAAGWLFVNEGRKEEEEDCLL